MNLATLLYFTWDPSKGIEIGTFTLHYYSLMFVLAFGIGYYLFVKMFKIDHESEKSLDTIFTWTLIGTILGARLGHVIFYQPELFKQDFWSVFLPIQTVPEFKFTGFSGLASHGAAIVLVISTIIIAIKVLKKNPLWLLDRLAITVALAGFFIRMGNFFNSEIVGTETTSSFGIKFLRDKYSANDAMQITQIGDKNEAYNTIATNPQFAEYLAAVTPKHPAQLYEAICYVFVFAILMFLYWKTEARNKAGYLFGLFLILLWSIRFVVEFVKESQGGFEQYPIFNALSTGQWLSIPFIFIGFYFVWKAKEVKED